MLKKQGSVIIAGVDEAGRGPLAGPVYAAAVILNPDKPILGLADSKILTEKKREELYNIIQEKALAYAVARAEVEEIDKINILQASLLAMQRAVFQLDIAPTLVLIDGIHLPKLPYDAKAIIQGDKIKSSISAASILAKVSRDHEMKRLCQQYPVYGFSKHKGYPTKEHLAALQKHGPCLIHRRSFAPVASLNENFA